MARIGSSEPRRYNSTPGSPVSSEHTFGQSESNRRDKCPAPGTTPLQPQAEQSEVVEAPENLEYIDRLFATFKTDVACVDFYKKHAQLVKQALLFAYPIRQAATKFPSEVQQRLDKEWFAQGHARRLTRDKFGLNIMKVAFQAKEHEDDKKAAWYGQVLDLAAKQGVRVEDFGSWLNEEPITSRLRV